MLSISRLHLVNLVKFLLQVNYIFFTRMIYLSIYQVASLPNTFKYWASIWVDCGLGFCMLRHIRCFCRFSVLNVSFGNLFLFCCSKHVCIASFTCNLAPPPALQFSSEFIPEIDIKRTDSREDWPSVAASLPSSLLLSRLLSNPVAARLLSGGEIRGGTDLRPWMIMDLIQSHP